MANISLYLAGCVLLLSWGGRTSTGLPVRAATTLSAEACTTCASLFKNLLLNIKELLKSEDLCFGIASDAVVVHSKAETLKTCAPTLTQNSGCMMQTPSSFSESECLKNIMKDLTHYSAAIRSYLAHPLRNPVNETILLSPTLDIITSLRNNCSLDGEKASSELNDNPVWGNYSYDNRQRMCQMMKGFYIRTITINRAMGYISSGDHRK